MTNHSASFFAFALVALGVGAAACTNVTPVGAQDNGVDNGGVDSGFFDGADGAICVGSSCSNGDGGVSGCEVGKQRCCTSTGFQCVSAGAACTMLDSACEGDASTSDTINVACQLGPDPLMCGGDATCSPYGATCGGTSTCVCPRCGGNILAKPPKCGPGLACVQINPDASGTCEPACTTDISCNTNPVIAFPQGTCNPDGTCACKSGTTKDLRTGKCG